MLFRSRLILPSILSLSSYSLRAVLILSYSSSSFCSSGRSTSSRGIVITLRQGAVGTLAHPFESARMAKRMLEAAGSEQAALAIEVGLIDLVRVVVGVPYGITNVETRAVREHPRIFLAEHEGRRALPHDQRHARAARARPAHPASAAA